MRIGVICEGPTDFPALELFIKQALSDEGLEAQLISIFPEMDKTRPEGGWGNVLNWLDANGPSYRIQRYFNGGLFSGTLSESRFDAIVVHLDADVVGDNSFRAFVEASFDPVLIKSLWGQSKGAQITEILRLALGMPAMCEADQRLHVVLPAVEATETWCVAAFDARPLDWRALTGAELINAFMTALERSESRVPEESYAEVDKNPVRRRRFCARHAGGASRIRKCCEYFESGVVQLCSIAKPIN